MNNYSNGELQKRTFFIKTSIIMMLRLLEDTNIDNIAPIIAYADNLFENAIYKRQLISSIEFLLWNKADQLRTVWSFEIDWSRHAFFVNRGDGYIFLAHQPANQLLTQYSGVDVAIKAFSEALYEMAGTIRGLDRSLQWRRCTWKVGFRSDVQGSDAAYINELRKGFGTLPMHEARAIQQFKDKNADLIFGVRPEILQEFVTTVITDVRPRRSSSPAFGFGYQAYRQVQTYSLGEWK